MYLHVLHIYFAYMPLKHPSESAEEAPRTDPSALIRSHAQSQPIRRVGDRDNFFSEIMLENEI